MSTRVTCTGTCGVQYHIAGSFEAMHCNKNGARTPDQMRNIIESVPRNSAAARKEKQRQESIKSVAEQITRLEDGSYQAEIEVDTSDADDEEGDTNTDDLVEDYIRHHMKAIQKPSEHFQYRADGLSRWDGVTVEVTSPELDDVVRAVAHHDGLANGNRLDDQTVEEIKSAMK